MYGTKSVWIADGFLHIKLPVRNPPQLSKSGKTLIVAGADGFGQCETEVDGKPISISVNAIVAK